MATAFTSCAARAMTAACTACEKGNTAEVERMHSRGWLDDLDAEDEHGRTPVTSAVRCGQLAVLQLLTGDVQCLGGALGSSRQQQRLHQHSHLGCCCSCRWTADWGADVNRPTREGWTPSHHAAFNGHDIVLHCLIEQGADINAADNNGCTPAHLAATANSLAVLTLLAENGGHLDNTSTRGKRPFDLAEQNNHVALLEAWPALEGAAHAAGTALAAATTQEDH